jgi:AcrR family transcriptional regulator
MTSQEPVDAAEAGPSWREQAVARSLDPARARAEKRVQRFLDAALALMSDSDNKDFTVQQVVERSGQSLRSFYQYFAGKYELLLALFEESVRTTAEHLADTVDEIDDPLDKLNAFLVEYHRICTPVPKGARRPKGSSPNPAAIAEFAQQLLTEHPREAAEAFGPLVGLLEGILQEGTAAGQLREDINHRRIAGILLQEIMFSAFASTISGTPIREGGPGDLWDLVLHGIAKRRS